MKKVMIITGTRKGLGRMMGEYYLEKDYVVAGCSRKGGSINHPDYYHYEIDVSDEGSVVNMVKDTAKRFGKIDMLINSAGMASMNHLLLTPYKSAADMLNTNFLGAFLLTREVGKIMVRRRYGRIINFSTVAVPFRLEGEAIYSASKSAVEQLTKVSARELAAYGITVNAIGPTPVKTDLIKNVPEEKLNDLINRQAIKRYGEFRDIVNVIDFFISDRSDFITGQIVYLGGVC